MLVKTVKDRLLSASLGAPGAAQVPNAGHLRARQGPALQGLAPGCLQLPGPVTGSTGGPPPPGWLSSMATSVLDMQQRQCASMTGPAPSVSGPAPPPWSPPSGSVAAAAPDANRQAAKRLKTALGQAIISDDQVSAVLPGGTSAAACQPSTLAPQCSAVVGSEDPPQQHQQDALQVARPASVPAYDEEPPPPCLLGPEAAETAVQFLGTGSAEPSKYR